MSTYDPKRLEIAIQYIRRMADGKNPVNGRPAPENEVLSNVNVHRCLKFIDEVLTDVHKNGGHVGISSKSSKVSVAETFPYETLQRYEYLQDQQISYFLKQLGEYLPEGTKMAVSATTITYWLRENGYLEKRELKETGREVSVPTRKGEDLGMYTEKAGLYPNVYYRIFYNEQAQRFLIENFRKILTESEELRRRNRLEKKSEDSPRSKRQGGNAQPQPYGAGAQPQSAPPQPYSAPPQPYNAPAQPYNEPDQMQDLPQEYYDMLSKGWDSSGDDVPW